MLAQRLLRAQTRIPPASNRNRERGAPVLVQPKLAIGAVNDPLEREADRAAGQVMRGVTPQIESAPAQPSRSCTACEEEVARAPSPQARTAPSTGTAVPPIVDETLSSSGEPLSMAARTFFEPRFGFDFSRVRVHADAQAARSARSIDALAYTAANHVVLNDSVRADDPASFPLLAHELTHVVQQGAASRGTEGVANRVSTTSVTQCDGGHQQQVQRQPAEAFTGLNMPAFPCDRGVGIELCNITTDSGGAPNYSDCLAASMRIIDACPGERESCLPRSKCAFCECVGPRYCQCTGIV